MRDKNYHEQFRVHQYHKKLQAYWVKPHHGHHLSILLDQYDQESHGLGCDV